MLLRIFLLFLCASTVEQVEIQRTTVAVQEKPSPLQLVATPDYPVAAGQRVDLHCSTLGLPDFGNWSWLHLENQTWKEVAVGTDLTLTKPEQSGLYQCRAKSRLPPYSVSPNHTVFIVSTHATVGENLGMAAFVLSLVALIINLAILFWLCYQRPGDTLITLNTAAKGFPGPEKSEKGGLPHTDSDKDVYMNYTRTNEAYTDLDHTNMTEDHVYSGLS